MRTTSFALCDFALTSPSDVNMQLRATNTVTVRVRPNHPGVGPFDYDWLVAALAQCGTVVSVTAYRNFGRVTVVYSADAASSSAYSTLNRTVIGDWTLYVIPEEPTCVDMHTSSTHLEVPPSTGAFVMSPPPSPPAGWAPDEESPPVQGLNLSMLALALDDLGSRLDGSGRLTLFEHEHPDVPRIVVEDFDADHMDSSAHPVLRPPFRPTERPPLPASMI